VKRVKDYRYLYRRGDQLYFRRKVPSHAITAFGGRQEVQKSLETCSLAEARHLLAIEVAKFDKAVATVTGKPVADAVRHIAPTALPSPSEMEEKVRHWLTERVERAINGELDTANRDPNEARQTWLGFRAHAESTKHGISVGADEPAITTIWLVEDICETEGWNIEKGSSLWRHLVRVVGRGQIEASSWLAQDLNGEARVVQDARFSPEQYRLDETRAKKRHADAPVSIGSLLEGYLKEHEPAPATEKVWRRHLSHFIAFLGHDDATRVTLVDVVAWKDKLLEQPADGRKQKGVRTVRDSYLPAVRSVFKWGAGNGKIAHNPVAGVRVGGKRKASIRDRGLTDDEAQMILAAALRPSPARLSPERKLARRWVPWLCAYTGARVNEITQLRAEDVKQQNGIWAIYITPEAGSVKNGKARTVALHPHLVAQGFLRAISGKAGPLFYDPSLHRGGSDGNPQYKKVGEFLARWVRDLGVSDPHVWPNHGWRHRFKSQARLVGINPETRDAIQGHAPRTEGERYGETPLKVIWQAIRKLPTYQITGV
jgi:integrase